MRLSQVASQESTTETLRSHCNLLERPLVRLLACSQQHFLVLITESAGCALSSCEQCCYRTFASTNKHMDLVQTVSQNVAADACLAGHPHYTASNNTEICSPITEESYTDFNTIFETYCYTNTTTFISSDLFPDY